MAVYKLEYFNLRGLAEVPRLIMVQAGIKFDDVRVPFDEWPKLKSTMPFGQMPVLEVGGKVLAQSHAIARFLARKHGLAGKDDWETARVDMYADCVKELQSGFPDVFGKDETTARDLLTEYIKSKVIVHLEILEKHLESSTSGYLVGNAVTWADIGYFELLSLLTDKAGKDFLQKFPKVSKLVQQVGELPNIKKWVETRPQTPV